MIKARINVKPLSVNEVWQGKRYKTLKYKKYEELLLLALPLKRSEVPCEPLKFSLTIGVSSKNADLDNAVKPLLDVLQKKYGFNDKFVYQICMKKVDVKKGKEFIEFKIEVLS